MKSVVLSLLLIASVFSVEYKVIDVSKHNGDINWAKVKAAGIDGAIIRCGYGSDQTDQDDIKYQNNVKGCIQNGIPFSVYLYSYAKTEDQARSEAAHVLRLVKPYKDYLKFPIYYDLEQDGTQSVAVRNAKIFIEKVEAQGYEVGIYANENWMNNVIKGAFDGRSLWVAKYGVNDGYKHTPPKISGSYDMWQYSSTYRVSGISGNVDISACYRAIGGSTPKPPSTDDIHSKTVDQLAKEVLAGVYGNGDERKQKLGDRYEEVQKRVNEILAGKK